MSREPLQGAADRGLPGRLTARLAGLDGVRLDGAVIVLALWSLFGVLLDVRGHDAGTNRFGVEGFLTLEHTIFYSGFAAIAVLVGGVVYANRVSGDSWVEAVPDGYRLGLVGVVIFGLGGPGDALWHAAFSAETGVEALTSPTHLMLATGSVLFLSSPLRAAWARDDAAGWRAQFPMLVSTALLLSSVTIVTLYGHPAYGLWPASGEATLGVVGILLQTGVLMGVLLTLLRRFDPAPGAFTLLLGLNGVAMTWVGQSYALLPGFLATGLLADALVAVARPSPARPRAFRLFAFGVPAVHYALYFLAIELTAGIAWVVHIWAGAIVLAGFAGLLLSYAMVPTGGPARPDGASSA